MVCACRNDRHPVLTALPLTCPHWHATSEPDGSPKEERQGVEWQTQAERQTPCALNASPRREGNENG
jgi:hypothetical protein